MTVQSNHFNGGIDKLPREFGKYHLIERIAAGGMAELYRAKLFGAGGFEKDLAIKKVLPQLSRDDSFIKMFMDEAMITVTLSHGNIVSVMDFGEVDGDYFLVMEYVDGVDVQSLIRKSTEVGEPFPSSIACYIVLETCKGLDYAHRKVGPDGRPLEIVHRDISPQNILISFEGEVKIADFGIARAASRITSTQAGVVKGKLSYMAPEQIGGQTIDRRADIYSLGVSLYEMLTLRKPFEGTTPQETLASITRGVFEPTHKANRKVDKKLSRMISRALERTPKRRYQTAGELAADLASYLHRAGVYPDAATLAAFVSKRLPEARPRTVQPTPIRAIRGEAAGRINTGVLAAGGPSAVSVESAPANEDAAPTEAVPFAALGLEQAPSFEPSDSKRPTDPERPAAAATPAAPSPPPELLHAPTIILPSMPAAEKIPAEPAKPPPEPAKPIPHRPRISPELAAAKTMLIEASAPAEVAGVLMPSSPAPAAPIQPAPAAPAAQPRAEPAPEAAGSPAPAPAEDIADAWLQKAPAPSVSTGAMRAQAFPKRSKLGPLLVAGFAVVAVLAVVGWLFLRPGGGQQSAVGIDQPTAAAHEAPAAPEPLRPAPEKTVPAPEPQPEPGKQPEAAAAAAPAAEPETPAPEKTTPEKPAVVPEEPKLVAPAAAPQKIPFAARPPSKSPKIATPKPPKRIPAEAPAVRPEPKTGKPAPEAKVAAVEKGSGTLRINSEPFAVIYMGDKRIGPTPQLNLKLPAGSHTLTLRNDTLGITRKVRVQITADQVHTVFVDLSKK